MGRNKSGVMRGTSSHRSLGIPAYFPQADKVLPEPKVEAVIIRGPKGFEAHVRNPARVAVLLAKNPGSYVVKQ